MPAGGSQNIVWHTTGEGHADCHQIWRCGLTAKASSVAKTRVHVWRIAYSGALNLGSLGFITQIGPAEMKETVLAALEGKLAGTTDNLVGNIAIDPLDD